jgi:hypothetical protein
MIIKRLHADPACCVREIRRVCPGSRNVDLVREPAVRRPPTPDARQTAQPDGSSAAAIAARDRAQITEARDPGQVTGGS